MNTKEKAIKSLKIMLGAELRRARENCGLSLEEAAAAAEIKRPYVIKNFEDGRGGKIFFIFKLLEVYHKNLEVKLTD